MILQHCMEFCSAAGSLFFSTLDAFHLESKHKHTKIQLNPKRNDQVSGWLKIRDSAALHGILQCPTFVSRLDPFHLENIYTKIQLNPKRND